DILRKAREAKNLDFDAISNAVKIKPQYLAAIEESKFSKLPGQAYVIGFMRTYADYLGLDAAKTVAQYKLENAVPADFHAEEKLDENSVLQDPAINANHIVIAGALALIGLFAAYFANRPKTQDEEEADARVENLVSLNSNEHQSLAEAAAREEARRRAAGAFAFAGGSGAADLSETAGASGASGTAGLAGPYSQALPGDAGILATRALPEASGAAGAGGVVGVAGAAGTAGAVALNTSASAGGAGALNTSAEVAGTIAPNTSPVEVISSNTSPVGTIAPNTSPAGTIAPNTSPAGAVVRNTEPDGAGGAAFQNSSGNAWTGIESVIISDDDAAAPLRGGRTYGLENKDSSRIELRAKGPVWVKLKQGGLFKYDPESGDAGDGTVVFEAILEAGDSYFAPDADGLFLSIGNAAALDIIVDGVAAPRVSSRPISRHNIEMSPQKLREGSAYIKGRSAI
ncbi:MAG: helix-turn-helix domain-containing protein, partial [Rickettsiales bacterium]|nr:helix-turn-helix domain-containing protein [Rickettsiales bacterium]